MTSPLLTETSITRAATLCDRFWGTAPGPAGETTPVTIVSHLLAVIARFRQVEGVAADETTMAGLSLITLLSQHQEQGDLRYASPEQLIGEPLTPRSEVFTVAVLLFERLCDRHPFGMGAIQIARTRRGELGSSVNFLPRLPPLLRAILTRALSIEADERYGDVDELAAALEMFVADARLQPELPGAPAVATIADRSPLVDAVRRRPISAWDRLRTDADEDERRAPDVAEQMCVEPTVDEVSRRRRRAIPHAYRELIDISDGAEPAIDPLRELFDDAETLDQLQPLDARADDGDGGDESMGHAEPARPRRRLVTAADSADAAPRRRRRRRARAALPFALGACAASLLFVVVGAATSPRTSQRGGQSAPIASAPSAELPTRSAGAVPTTSEPVVHSLAPDLFDPGELASAALSEAIPCFADLELDREIGFGLGILYEPGDLSAHQVYFPSEPELSPERQACVDEAVLQVKAAVPPDRATAIELRLTLAATGSAVEVKRLRH